MFLFLTHDYMDQNGQQYIPMGGEMYTNSHPPIFTNFQVCLGLSNKVKKRLCSTLLIRSKLGINKQTKSAYIPLPIRITWVHFYHGEKIRWDMDVKYVTSIQFSSVSAGDPSEQIPLVST